MKITIYGNPITKKNHQRIVHIGRPPKQRHVILQSARYLQYEKDCLAQITGAMKTGIDHRVNVRCEYYMERRGRVDLVNLLEATDDILVRGGVLKDDNAKIIGGHDGSRVLYDKANPRVEILITELLEE